MEVTEPKLDLRNLVGDQWPIMLVTDCKSLFDNLQKDGSPKTPSEKRLSLDLAAVKDMLKEFEDQGDTCRAYKLPIRWIPTELMLADGLTKIMKGEKLRQTINEGYLELPLVDSREAWSKMVATSKKEWRTGSG